MKIRTLVWSTLALFVVLILATHIGMQHTPPQKIEIKTEGHPTIGNLNAPIKVIVLEEIKCTSCKDYSDNIYPKIKEKYIDTGKITYTMIPVSFLPHSMPAAVASLCVYNQNNERNSTLFFDFVNYIYHHQPAEDENWATVDTLTKMARNTSRDIDITKLRSCIEKNTFQQQVEENTRYGASLMHGKLSTPAVFINGVLVDDLSYNEIERIIDEKIQQQEEARK